MSRRKDFKASRRALTPAHIALPICFLALGSNLGNRRKRILKAIKSISLWPKTRFLRSSSILETDPLSFANQPKFLNCVVKIQTRLSPAALLLWAKITETELGRQRRRRWGPREIDIDIIFYGRKKIKTALLVIPHPKWRQRGFVVKGLRELEAL